jgi:hypothetical protein
MDKSIVKHGIKRIDKIKELAEYSVGYTIDKKIKSFKTDTLYNKIRREFNRNGCGGVVTVTYSSKDNNQIIGLLDSSVIFKQITFRGITEIIYDFSANKKQYYNDTSNIEQFVFLKVGERIYYRRRPVPFM